MPKETTTDRDERRTESNQFVEILVTPPREPAVYRPRDHFLQRLRERVPEYQRNLPREVIKEGRVCRVPGADVTENPDYGTPVAFTKSVDGKPWTVVVALRPDSLIADDAKHDALTLFQGTPTPLVGSGVTSTNE